jgi:hypothetical protein
MIYMENNLGNLDVGEGYNIEILSQLGYPGFNFTNKFLQHSKVPA